MNTAQPKPSLGSALAQLFRHDWWFLPAAVVAVLGTIYAAVVPPTWLGRVPAAVVDVVSGDRDELTAELGKATGERAALDAELAEATQGLAEARAALDQASASATANAATIGEQRSALAKLEQTLQEREAEIASLTAAAPRQQVPELQAKLAEATRAGDAGRRMVEQQARALADQRARLAEAERSNAEAERVIREERNKLVSLERDLDAARSRVSARDTDVARLNVSLQSLQGERDGLAASVRGLRSRLTQTVERLASVERAAQADSTELMAQQAKLGRQTAALRTVETERDTLGEDLASARAALGAMSSTSARTERALQDSAGRLAREQAEVARLAAALRGTGAERDDLREGATQLTQRVTAVQGELATSRQDASALRAQLSSAREGAAELKREAQAERTQVTELEQRLTALNDELEANRRDAAAVQTQLATARDGLTAFETRLAGETGQRQAIESELRAGQSQLRRQEQRIARLDRQAEAMQGEVLRLLVVLRAAAEKAQAQARTIADRAGRNDGDDAGKVAELERFRSEFFGQLGFLLGGRQDIEVVGDRFVFQAEVLFASSSAELEADGRAQLAQVATALNEISRRIPPAINWVLQVDGHTDREPIQTALFPSNWELSSARAISVVQFFVAQGVPPERLSANGFGEFQPIDKGASPSANRRNRRIELKLTQR